MYPPLKSFKLVVIVTTCHKFDKLIMLFENICFLLFKSHFKQLYSLGNRLLVLVFCESSVASFSIPIEYWNLFLSSETFWKTPYLFMSLSMSNVFTYMIILVFLLFQQLSEFFVKFLCETVVFFAPSSLLGNFYSLF